MDVKSKKSIEWIDMLKKMESLGYAYTGDYSFTPKGYERKQPLYRFDYRGKEGTHKLSIDELKKEFDGKITVILGTPEYAPEQSFMLITNRLYESEAKAENNTGLNWAIGLATASDHWCRSLALDAIYCYLYDNDDLWNPWAGKKDLFAQRWVDTKEQNDEVTKKVHDFVTSNAEREKELAKTSQEQYRPFFEEVCSFISKAIEEAKGEKKSGNTLMVEFDVDWDCDEEGEAPESHFATEVDFDDIDIDNKDAVMGFLSDWLSEEYGFTHNGFTAEIIDEQCKEKKMNETSLSRIYDLITRDDVVFGVISAYRKDLLGENPDEEKLADLNEKRHMELKNILSKGEPRYGFVELRGAYKEEGYQGKDIFEKSLLVGKIPREKLIELGKKYNQDSVIWHGDGKFELIYLNGDEPAKFSKKALSIEGKSVEELKKLVENDPEKFERMFIVGSWLTRGKAVNKNRKYSFVLESRMSPSVNRGLIEQKYGPEQTWRYRMAFSIG